MAEIKITAPPGRYTMLIDTEAMGVVIKKAFLGVGFVTDAGEHLSVSMRDTGYELTYTASDGVQHRIELKGGEIV